MSAFTVRAAVQCYVEQLRRCLQLEASDQPSASASVGVVKLANEIVSGPAPDCCIVHFGALSLASTIISTALWLA